MSWAKAAGATHLRHDGGCEHARACITQCARNARAAPETLHSAVREQAGRGRLIGIKLEGCADYLLSFCKRCDKRRQRRVVARDAAEQDHCTMTSNALDAAAHVLQIVRSTKRADRMP